jgi:hypothetical protein
MPGYSQLSDAAVTAVIKRAEIEDGVYATEAPALIVKGCYWYFIFVRRRKVQMRFARRSLRLRFALWQGCLSRLK